MQQYWINGVWVVAGVNLAVGSIHLVTGILSGPGDRRAANIWFGVGTLAYMLTMVTAAGVYLAESAHAALPFHRLSISAYVVYTLCLYGLIAATGRRSQARVAWIAGPIALLIVAVNHLRELNFAISPPARLIEAVMPWGERLQLLDGAPSRWLPLGVAFALAPLLHAWYVARKTRPRPYGRHVLVVAVAVTIYAAGAALDMAFLLAGRPWLFTTDLTHTALIVVLSYELGSELLRGRVVRRRLTEAEERFQALIEHSPSAIFVKNLDGAYTSVNRRFVELVELPESEILGKRADEIPSPAMQPSASSTDREVLSTGRQVSFEAQMSTLDRHGWIKVVKFPLRDERNEIYAIGGIVTDMTDSKRVERELEESRDRLSRLASQLLTTEERERHEIATYLHDHVGQTLVALRMKLEELRGDPELGFLETWADQTRKMIEDTLEDTRAVTLDLSPPILYDLGLEAALAWLAERAHHDEGLHCEFRSDRGIGRIDTEPSVLLFRCTSELMTNVIRHAEAESVSIELAQPDDLLRVTVEDDGKGLEPADLEPGRTGFGLFSIRERMKMSGGTLDIDSRPGRGTQATLSLPVSSAQ